MTWQFSSSLNIGDRDDQQDHVAILRSGDAYLIVLADGMGGRNDGALAAQTVLDIARHRFSLGDHDRPGMFLAMICLQAHEALLAHTVDSGSTCVVLYLLGNTAYCAHVGDSRMYQIRNRQLIRRTSDHSISQLITDRRINPEELADDQAVQNQLYMCLGGKNKVIPELSTLRIRHGDLLLLCSDGLWNQIDEQEIITHMDTSILEAEVADNLTAQAKKQGQGQSDNISMVCAYWQNERNDAGSGLFNWKPGWLSKSGTR